MCPDTKMRKLFWEVGSGSSLGSPKEWCFCRGISNNEEYRGVHLNDLYAFTQESLES
jgi:hypothetical protein